MDSHELEDEAAPRVVVLDTETTGRSHAQGDRIVEIGAVEVIGNMRTGSTWHSYVNPCGQRVEEGAREVHGLTDQFLADKPKFRSIYRDFFAFLGDSPLIIHNASFDTGFINNERKLIGLGPMTNEIRDTLRLARIKWPGQRATLDALCSRLGVDNSQRTKHGALLDSEILADVYIKMMGLDQLALECDDPFASAAPEAAAREAVILIPRRPRPSRPAVLPTDEEEALFRAFIDKNVKDSFWLPAASQIG